jgi:hypothetical protein
LADSIIIFSKIASVVNSSPIPELFALLLFGCPLRSSPGIPAPSLHYFLL